ncbi:MAG TPA: hypothetical protein VGI70_13275 [Polyangiales bacterium]|jgi:hypothetical protein
MQLRGSFALLFALLAFAPGARAQERVADKQLAHDEYAAGVSAFQRGEDESAREHFTAADRAFASPNVKLMLGRALVRLQQLTAAHAVWSAALRDAEASGDARYGETISAAKEALALLSGRLATITLRVDDETGGASLRVNGREIERSGWGEPIVSEPGSIEIALTAPDGRRDVEQVELGAGASASLELQLTTPPPLMAASATEPDMPTAPPSRPISLPVPERRNQPVRAISYAGAGVGLVGIAAFGVLGALSNAEWSKLDRACPGRIACDPALEGHASRGRTYEALANVSLGVGIAALATGVVLFVLSAGDEKRPNPSAQAALLGGRF